MGRGDEVVRGEFEQQSDELAADNQAVKIIKIKELRGSELTAEQLTQIADAIRPLAPQLKEFRAQLKELRDHFVEAMEGVSNWWNANAPQIKAAIAWFASIDWPAVLAAIPEHFRRAIARAAAHGWFVGCNGPAEDIFDLTEKINSAEDVDIDKILVAYYSSRMNTFNQELCATYPHRAKPIGIAVSTHQGPGTDGFFLSVPVFLAQADGILCEITGCQSPMSKSRKDNTNRIKAATFLELNADDGVIAFGALDPIFDIIHSGLLTSSSERSEMQRMQGKSFNSLNRHQVMHGESSDYGSEVNSFKAFSLLTFIGLHLPMVLKGNQPPPLN